MHIKTATNIMKSALIVSALIGIATIAIPANAQSFSCANAQIPSEHAICNNENLLIKDERLALAFADALVEASKSNAIGEVSSDHSQWLRQRNACRNDFTCLDQRYQERLDALKKSGT